MSLSATLVNFSIFSAISSAISWSFLTIGLEASFLSASSNAFLSVSEIFSPESSAGCLSPCLIVGAVVAGVASFTWSLFLNLFSTSLLALAVAFWSSNSLAACVAVITPSSIAFNKASLPIAALASSLFVILASASISFSSWSKAALRASKLSFSSFLSSQL